VSVVLQAASDTGCVEQRPADTNDNTPTLNVTVNQPGTITLDINGDNVADVTVNAAGRGDLRGDVAAAGGRCAHVGRDVHQRFEPYGDDEFGRDDRHAGAEPGSAGRDGGLRRSRHSRWTFSEAIDPATFTAAGRCRSRGRMDCRSR